MEPTLLSTVLGTIRGLELPSGVRRYAGIRYALAERFRGPQLQASWSEEYDATAYGPHCPQIFLGAPLVPGTAAAGAGSEDCLSLNIWVPSGPGPWPVLVWIHGGSFITGASSQPTYDGASLAGSGEGAVVVSVNYRVGPFGFLALAEVDVVPDEGAGDDVRSEGWVCNAGLRDIDTALTWVRRHISEFGGDASNVTVMGESAGGGAILHLLGASNRAQRFDRAIVQSGSAGRTFDRTTAKSLTDRFLAIANCDATTLATMPADQLVSIATDFMRDPAVFALAGMMPFHPMLDDDLVLVKPMEAAASGTWNGCDLIMGCTRDEMQLFVEPGPMDFERVAKRVARYLSISDDASQDVARKFQQLLHDSGLHDDGLHVWGAIFSDQEMTLPMREILDASAAHHESTYAYYFTWSAPMRGDGRPLGAAHAVDLPFTFGTFDQDGWAEFVGAADSRADAATRLSHEMQLAWVQFAANGSPGWPAYGSQRVMQELGEVSGVVADPLRARAALLGWPQ